jgi:translation initiation factor IF-1
MNSKHTVAVNWSRLKVDCGTANCTTTHRPGKNNHWRMWVKSGDAKQMAQPFLDAGMQQHEHQH